MKITDIKNIKDLTEKLKTTKRFSELIKLKCYECCNYELSEVRKCTIVSCPLYRVRGGRRIKE